MLRIEITKSGLATIGRNGFREIGRQAIGAAVAYWSSHYKPLHFQNVAYLRYGYQSRTKKYNESKQRRLKAEDGMRALGEVKPLVFTGRSRDRALGQSKIRTRAPNYQTYVGEEVIDAPAFNFGIGKRINMRDEVTRLNDQESKTLDRIFTENWNKSVERRMAASPKVTRKTAA